MEFSVLQQEIAQRLSTYVFRFDEPMSKHTSFRIGGPAEVMLFPQNVDELSHILKMSNELGVFPAILGAGTNVLAPDSGMKGIVICLKDCMSGIKIESENHLRVAAGVTMTRAAAFAANNGLAGLEFAHGIPGTVGGGVYMNAGAYGGEIGQVCESVTVMDRAGNINVLPNSEMTFSYRHSVLEESGNIVLEAVFSLKKDDSENIWARMKELLSKRSASQPLDLPSAGSAFKRPIGGYAAALIDQAGLKGYRVGGAGISEKHAGFAVNYGGATAKDVMILLEQVAEKVFSDSGIKLEPEIRIW